MNKETILTKINFLQFYRGQIPSLKETGKGEAIGVCPFHQDTHPSFSVNLETGLFNCYAGCPGGDVFDFYQRVKKVSFPKALIEIGHQVGADVKPVKHNVVGIFKYHDEDGQVVYWKERIEPGRDGRKKEFLFYHFENEKEVKGRSGDPIPYNLPELIQASGPVYFTEGEAKANQLINWGLMATCLDTGVGSSWRLEYLSYFRNKDVIFLPDNDGPGRAYAQRIAGALAGHVPSIKIVNLSSLPEKGDIVDWVKDPGNTKEKFLEIVEAFPNWEPDLTKPEPISVKKEIQPPSPAQGDEGWADPIPLDEYSLLPEFPVAALSSVGREIVQAVSEVNQVDPGLPATIYLSVLATCLAKKGEVDLITHREPLNINTCSILPSGERKTRTEAILSKPIYAYQEIRQAEVADQIREKYNMRKIDEMKLLRLQKEAAGIDEQTERLRIEREAAIIAKKIQDNPVPNPPIFIVDDITAESLGIHMTDNNERIGLFSTEGGIFSIMAGRYGERGGNFDLFLKAHSGDPWSSHRVGREAKTMQAPALTMCLTVQPDVIAEIGKNRQFSGRGLLARFLFQKGKPQAGYRLRQVKSIPESLLSQYRDHVFGLLDIPLVTRILTLSPEGQELWDMFYNDIEMEIRPGGSLEDIKDWGSKLPGEVARIAGQLHYAEHGKRAPNIPISYTIVSASCVIGAYYKDHALAVFDLMRFDQGIESAKKINGYLINHKPGTFKGRDILRHTNLKTMDDVAPGLKILVERGFIRATGTQYTGTGRPEAKIYEVNPKIFKMR